MISAIMMDSKSRLLPSIVANCKQTRFHLRDEKGSGEASGSNASIVPKSQFGPSQLGPGASVCANLPVKVNIQGLSISVSSPHIADSISSDNAATVKPKSRAKSKSKTEGIEILSSADLRLKAGVHYGLVGRNGTGKSSMSQSLKY